MAQTSFKSLQFRIYIFDNLEIMKRTDRAKPGSALQQRSLTAYLSESIKNRDVKFGHYYHTSRLQFVLLTFGIDISDNFETMCFSAT